MSGLTLWFALPRKHHPIYNRNMSRTSSLFRLQELDLDLDQCAQRVEEIQIILADNLEIQRLQQTLAENESDLKEIRMEHSQAEHEVSLQRTKIERTEKTLYDGSIRNPKELQERQQEAESLKRYLATLEDRLLEAMLKLDDAAAKAESANSDLAQALEATEASHQNLIQELERLQAKIERLSDEREAALANIAERDQVLYNDLRERYKGLVIALVQEGSCNACGLQLAHSLQQSIRSGSEPIRCNQCGRILYAG
jgi:predicted  nucleic acid-binding Zn-ribbon protein